MVKKTNRVFSEIENLNAIQISVSTNKILLEDSHTVFQ